MIMLMLMMREVREREMKKSNRKISRLGVSPDRVEWLDMLFLRTSQAGSNIDGEDLEADDIIESQG